MSLTRPTVIYSNPINKTGNIQSIKNKRIATGNSNIIRPYIESEAIKWRIIPSFISKSLEVELGSKTLDKLFKIQVDDPLDTQWIQEKNRRIALGETLDQIKASPPFGRPQRKIDKMVNFATAGLTQDDKLEAVKSAVDNGFLNNRADAQQLTAQVALILGDIAGLSTITQTGLNDLDIVIRKLNVPANWKEVFPNRIFSVDQYRGQSGLINLFLLSNLDKFNRRLDRPVFMYDEQLKPTGYVSITQIINNLQSKVSGNSRVSKFLDLELRGIIPENVAIDLANSGVDQGLLNGRKPPPEPPNNGVWLKGVPFAWNFSSRAGIPANLVTQG